MVMFFLHPAATQTKLHVAASGLERAPYRFGHTYSCE